MREVATFDEAVVAAWDGYCAQCRIEQREPNRAYFEGIFMAAMDRHVARKEGRPAPVEPRITDAINGIALGPTGRAVAERRAAERAEGEPEPVRPPQPHDPAEPRSREDDF